jgi:hypothetical protein
MWEACAARLLAAVNRPPTHPHCLSVSACSFAAYHLGRYSVADRALKKASEEILGGRKLLAASGSLEEGLLEAQCRGTAAADLYTVSVRFDPPEANGQVVWGEPSCSCPQGARAGVCKHALALLLARLDPAKWKSAQSTQPVAAEVGGQAGPAATAAAAAGPAAAAAGGAAAAARAAAAGAAAGAGGGGGGAPQAGKRKLPSILAAPAPK